MRTIKILSFIAGATHHGGPTDDGVGWVAVRRDELRHLLAIAAHANRIHRAKPSTRCKCPLCSARAAGLFGEVDHAD